VELLLEAKPFAARTGRRWVMGTLRAAGRLPRKDAELVELLAGELLANAVVHGPTGGPIRVWASHDGSSVRVAVRDEGTGRPRVKHPAPTAQGGRGVGLIDTLATRWGIEDDGAAGKTVWFVLDLAAP
jgi:anti-sigma regulatory factor (Ser/Thr protein kinase)